MNTAASRTGPPPAHDQFFLQNSGVAKRFTRVAFTAALTFAALTSSMLAQQKKTLNGVVHDPLGALVPGASVDLLKGDAVIALTKTGPDGVFHLEVSASDRYRLRVTAPSFETTTTSPVYVSGPNATDLDITLATQTLTQQITVTANGTPLPEAQTGASVTVVPGGDFRYMPEIQDPLRLVPGLQMTQIGQMGGSSGLSIRGGGTDANKVLIDGVPANISAAGSNSPTSLRSEWIRSRFFENRTARFTGPMLLPGSSA